VERYHNLIMDNARWDGFEFRDDDIVISVPAKCGTTWTQMICALLIFQRTEFPAPLTDISPWMEVLTARREDVWATLAAQQHRRFIKSHCPLDGLPFDPRVTYITVGRDPRDVAISWSHHMENLRVDRFIELRAAAVGLDDLAEVLPDGPPPVPEDPIERMWSWIEAPAFAASGLREMVHHIDTFWRRRDEPNVVMLHYADLQADLEGQMRALGDRLGLRVSPALVEAATFERMRTRAADLAPQTTSGYWRDDSRFFHAGTSGQWHFSREDQARYERAVTPLASPELNAWLHR
jgi:hypothetical protein